MDEKRIHASHDLRTLLALGWTYLLWFLIQQPRVFFQARPDEIRLFRSVQHLASGQLDIPPFSAVLPLLSLPFYGLGSMVASLTGNNVWIKFFTHGTNAVLGAVLLGFFYWLSRKLFLQKSVAVVLTIMLAMATPVNFYAASYFNEIAAALMILVPFSFMLDSNGGSQWLYAVSGLFCGVAVLNRVDALMALMAFTVFVVLRRRSRFVPFSIGAVSGLVVVALVWWGLATHQPGHAYGHARFTTPPWVGFVGYLFSFGRSIFLYAPVVLLSMLGLRSFVLKQKDPALLGGLITGAYLLLYIHFWSWHTTWGWGPRYLVKLIPLLMLPAGEFLRGAWPGLLKVLLSLILFVPSVVLQLSSTIVNYQNSLILLTEIMNQSPMNIMFNPYISPLKWHLEELVATPLYLHYFWVSPGRGIPLLVLVGGFLLGFVWILWTTHLVERSWNWKGTVAGCLIFFLAMGAAFVLSQNRGGLERVDYHVNHNRSYREVSVDGWLYQKIVNPRNLHNQITWRGQIYLSNSWEYQFGAIARGKVKIQVDDQIVVDKNEPPAEFITSEESYYDAGWHPITITFHTKDSGIFKFLIFSPKQYWRIPWPSELRTSEKNPVEQRSNKLESARK